MRNIMCTCARSWTWSLCMARRTLGNADLLCSLLEAPGVSTLRNFSTAFINGIVGTAIKEDNVSKADMQVIAFNLERKPTMALSGIYSIGKTMSWATSQK